MKATNHVIKKTTWSLLHATLLVIVTYFIWNIPYDWTDSGKWLQRIHLAKAVVTETDTLPDDLILINTCYDHTMIPAHDELGMECGQIDITDRAKLFRLLQYLATTNDYRYIVCDIDFNSDLQSSYDSQLFYLINKMPRCVIPNPTEGVSLPAIVRNKSAVSEYSTNIQNNNFLKYYYLTASGESMALRMAREMNNVKIDKYGPFYFVNGKVCINAHILDIETNVRNEYQQDNAESFELGRKTILQLGTDVLPMIDADIKGLFANKIVMIGDCFRDDIHTTVAGSASGLIIIYNAYHALVNQNNVPPLWVWTALLIVYFLLTLAIFYKITPQDILPRNWPVQHPLLCKLAEWVGFHILFTFVGLLSFLCAKTYIDAWLFATYFTLFESVFPFIVNILSKSSKRFKFIFSKTK